MRPAEILDILDHLGLTQTEARLYMALEPLDVATAAELCRRSGVPPSKAYAAMRSLEAMGLVVTAHGRPMRFVPEPFARAIPRLLAQRRRVLEDIASKAKSLAEWRGGGAQAVPASVRAATDEVLREFCTQLAAVRVDGLLVLTPSGRELLTTAGSRLGIDLISLVEGEWDARSVRGQIIAEEGPGPTFAVADGAVAYLLVPGDVGGVLATINSPTLAQALSRSAESAPRAGGRPSRAHRRRTRR